MKLTNKRIVGGVVALLAVVSLAQTQAILQIAKASNANRTSALAQVSSEDQQAQVLSTVKGCLQLLPADSNYTSFVDPSVGSFPEGLAAHSFSIGVKIKNVCNVEIAVITDMANQQGSVIEIGKFESFPSLTSPTLTAFQVYGPYAPIAIDQILGNTNPNVLNIPIANLNEVPVHEYFEVLGALSAFEIPAFGTKNFVVTSTAVSYNSNHHTRFKFKNLRWFKTSSYDDNLLSANEVKVYNIPNSETIFTTSYAIFTPSGAGMVTQEEANNYVTKIMNEFVAKMGGKVK